MSNAFDEFDAPGAFDEFDLPAASVVVPAKKLTPADQAAMLAARARDANVSRFIPGTGVLTLPQGRRSNQQSQALLQGYTFNTADELAAALDAAKTGTANLFGRGAGFSAKEAYDARMRQEANQMGQYQSEHPKESLAANLTGTVLNPLSLVGGGYAAAGKGVLPVMGRAALVSGAQGAVAGAGAGDDLGSRAGKAALGGITGAAIGGAVTGIGQKLAQGLAKANVIKNAPLISDLKAAKDNLYAQAENAGVIIKNSSIAKFANDLKNQMANEGITPNLHPNAFAALEKLRGLNQNLTLKGAEIERRILQNRVGDAAGVAARGGQKDDLRIARIIVDKYDDFIENLHPNSTLAGTSSAPAVNILKDARAVYSKMAKGETIENLIQKAKNNSSALKTNLEQNIKSEFKKLANNNRGISRFSQDEQDAIRNVANGSVSRNVISALGRLAPNANLLGLGELGLLLTGHVAPVATAVGAGIPSKIAATMATEKAARYAAALAKGAQAPVVNAVPAVVAGRIAGASVAPRTKEQ
jgi:hypothetical protein